MVRRGVVGSCVPPPARRHRQCGRRRSGRIREVAGGVLGAAQQHAPDILPPHRRQRHDRPLPTRYHGGMTAKELAARCQQEEGATPTPLSWDAVWDSVNDVHTLVAELRRWYDLLAAARRCPYDGQALRLVVIEGHAGTPTDSWWTCAQCGHAWLPAARAGAGERLPDSAHPRRPSPAALP